MKAKSELELQRIKAEQAQREQETAQAYKRAVEGAILSETSANFGTLDRERIEQSLSKGIGGGTRSGQDVAFGSITTDATRQEQRIIISTSDDDFVRAEVGSIQTAGDAGAAASDSINQRGDISNIDTSTIRVRQVRRTMENLNNETELIYAFWGRNGVLPTAGEYSTINSQTGLTDFWGNTFTYNRIGDHEATLTATTPWGQVLVVPIDLTVPDTTPDPFSFVDRDNQPLNTVVYSVDMINFIIPPPVVPVGYDTPTSITISGPGNPEYRLNWEPYTSSPGTISPGDDIKLRVTTPASSGLSHEITVTVGSYSTIWTVDTIP